jgi:hypothetical protein
MYYSDCLNKYYINLFLLCEEYILKFLKVKNYYETNYFPYSLTFMDYYKRIIIISYNHGKYKLK